MMRPRMPDPKRFRSWIPEVNVEEVRAVVTYAVEAYDAATIGPYEPPRGPMGSRPDLVEAVRAGLVGRDPETMLDACAHLLDRGAAGGYGTPSPQEETWTAALTLLRRVMFVEPWYRRTQRQLADGTYFRP